ncbi:MAG: Jag N-terminal domain-containing protein [Candidatus Hydrogenedentes bacterium]|nr:Jag N-terminal domain-containing protein [Candidatus Hydrogenedentota bacterium]
MPSVESSAKTRKEAIQLALDQLGVEMHDVDEIEILDEGSRGFLGLGARPVRVRVTAKRGKQRPAAQDERRPEQRERQTEGAGDERRRGPRDDRRGRDRHRGRDERVPRREHDGRPAAPAPRDEQRRDAGDRPAPSGQRDEQRRQRDRGDRQHGRDRAPRHRDDPGREPRAQRQRRPDQGPQADRRRAQEEPGPEALNQPLAQETESSPLTEDQGREAAALLQSIISQMGIEATVEFRRDGDGAARLDVATQDSALLIGRKGRSLQAMQYLINRIIARSDKNEVTERLVVDIEGYVDRRRDALEGMARGLAERAKESGRDVRLKPMSPQERRVIHLTLQGDPDVRTFSIGDALYRQVVISPRVKQPSGGQGGPASESHHRPRGGIKRRASGRLMRPRPANMRRGGAPQRPGPQDSGNSGEDAGA